MAITRTKIFSVEGQSPIVLHDVPQSVELVGDITWKDEEQTIIDDFTAKIKTKDEYSTGVPHKVIKRVDTLNTASKTWTTGTQETYEAQEKEFTLNYRGHERDFEVTFDEEGTPVIRYRWSMNDAHDLTIGGGGANSLPLGGKIFYIDSSDNGATYHFYDESGSEIEGWTDIASLADAVSYSVEGEPTADKFYVYYPTKFDSLQWWDNKTTTHNTKGTAIGTGKTNTATVMSLTLPSSGTIWNKLSDVITSTGIDDWFVPSRGEIDKFKEADFESWARSSGGSYLWSSTEYTAPNAYFYFQRWQWEPKTTNLSVFFARAF